MSRLHIKIDPEQMNQSKKRTIQKVMNNIDSQHVEHVRKRRLSFSKESIIFSFMLVIALIVMITVGDNNGTVEIQAYETKEIANTTYLTAGIISMSNTVNDLSVSTGFVQLGLMESLGSTNFEQNINQFNYYFDMLRVYVDQVDLQEIITFEELIDSEFDYKLSYVLDNQLHEFYISQNKTFLSGELHIENTVFIVEGTLEKNNNEIGLELVAYNGEDYVKISYTNEIDDEIEKKYHIEQKMDQVIIQREITVKIEDDETVVEIKEDNAEYKISKTVLTDGIVYEVEYEVGNQEGEVEILITIDEFGNEVFRYDISENGEEVEIDLDDPDEDDEHHDEEDEEDEEDEKDEEDEEDEEDF